MSRDEWLQARGLRRPFGATQLHLFLLLLFIVAVLFVGQSDGAAIDDFRRQRAQRSGWNESADPDPDHYNDIVCNNGSEFECICYRGRGPLDKRRKPCHELIQQSQLSVVNFGMRKVNLDARLHTNESYQNYFRRRISNIVSQYCEQHVDECPNATLRMTKQNVVIVAVKYMPRRRTEVQFVVAQKPKPGKLNDESIVKSATVKHILGSQLAPLSRILGGVQIDKLQLTTVDGVRDDVDNSRLITMLTIIAVLMLCCYSIAVIKCCRERAQRRQAANKSSILTEQKQSNYGTCADKVLSCDVPNGKPKSKSISSRVSISSSLRGRKVSNGGVERRSTGRRSQSSKRSAGGEDNYSVALIDVNRNDIPSAAAAASDTASQSGNDTRSFQRMFACDLSQLPAESCDFLDDRSSGDAAVFSEDVEAGQTPLSTRQSNGSQNIQSADIEFHDTPSRTPSGKRPPIVPIVIASGSQFSIDKDQVSLPPQPPDPAIEEIKHQYQHQDSTDSVAIFAHVNSKGSFLDPINEGGAYDRPLSRRGSRDSTPEQGIEEFADNLSEDLMPIGDNIVESAAIETADSDIRPMDTSISIPEIAIESAQPVSRWSSESDMADAIYQKLKEEEGEPREHHEHSSESEDENTVLERHTYERLQESPLASPSHANNNNATFQPLKDIPPKETDYAERLPEDEDLR